MFKLVKSIVETIGLGAAVVYRSVRRSIAEEIELSRQLARMRYEGGPSGTGGGPPLGGGSARDALDARLKMGLDEAMRILNVTKLERDEIETRYSILFDSNRPTNGGSFYLQSKIYRARERIDLEMKQKKMETTTGKTLKI